MNLTAEQIKLCIVIALAAIALAAAGVGGWTLNGWRLSGQINKLQGTVDTQLQTIATLKGANDRCTAGVAEVTAAVKGYVDAGSARSEEAKAAMLAIADQAAGHLAAAKSAMNRPPPARGKECDAVAAEASAYARKRKAAP